MLNNKRKNKSSQWKQIFILITIFLFVGSNARAVVVYDRTPTGFLITSPVYFDVSFDDWSETGCSQYDPEFTTTHWGIDLRHIDDHTSLWSDLVSSTTQSAIFEINVPIGFEAGAVRFLCYGDFSYGVSMITLEYDEGLPIFEIVEPEPEPEPTAILTISQGNITTLLANVGAVVADVSVLMWLAIGLPLGFWVVKKVISLIR